MSSRASANRVSTADKGTLREALTRDEWEHVAQLVEAFGPSDSDMHDRLRAVLSSKDEPLDVERLPSVDDMAKAYHHVGCVNKRIAFHSCKYRDAHIKTMTEFRAALSKETSA